MTDKAPSWLDVYNNFINSDEGWKRMQANYGGQMDRAWNADPDAAAQKLRFDDMYLQQLAEYNKSHGTNIEADKSVLGVNAQPNDWNRKKNDSGGMFGGIATGLTDLSHSIADSPLAMAAITAIAAANGVPPEITAAALGANKAGEAGNLQSGLETGVLSYGLGSMVAPGEVAGPSPANPMQLDPSQMVKAVPAGLSGMTMPSLGTLAKYGMGAASLLGALDGGTPAAQGAPTRSASQEEYFNRPLPRWDWDKIQAEAAAAGMDPNTYIAKRWNQMQAGNAYEKPPVKLAAGGAPFMGGAVPMGGLGEVARLARGSGSGRADTIDARLSDGEYVMDAETVAMLGDGSTKEGAQRLDAMREHLRRHKGKQLAQGKISPNAKSPLAYIKEAP